MKKIKILEYYAGPKAKFYVIRFLDKEDDEFTLLAQELIKAGHEEKVVRVVGQIKFMADKTGARDYFKDEGPNCVFRFRIRKNKDKSKKKEDAVHPARFYCIKYGESVVLLGGGGIKLPGTEKTQDQTDLDHATKVLGKINETLTDLNIKGYEIEDYINKVFEIEGI